MTTLGRAQVRKLSESKLEENNPDKTDSYGSFHGSTHSKSLFSGLTGLSHSTSDFSDHGAESKHQWKSQWQHAIYFLAYTTSWMSFTSFNLSDHLFAGNYTTNVYQVILGYVFFGYPTVLIQTFMGQFTQRGCLVFGEMMPIAYGLGYLFLFNTILTIILNLYYSSFLLFYFFVAVFNHPTPAWMLCLKRYLEVTTRCFGIQEINKCTPCFSPRATEVGSCYQQDLHNLSASLFLNFVLIETPKEKSSLILNPPDIKYVVHLTIVVIILGIAIMKNFMEMDGPLRIWNIISLVTVGLLIVVVLFSNGRGHGLMLLFNFRWQSFFTYQSWVDTIRLIITQMKLSEAGNFYFGSYTPTTVSTTSRSAYITLVHFSTFIFFNLFFFLVTENFLCLLNTDISQFSKYEMTGYILAFLPAGIAVLPAASYVSTLYFLIIFGLTIQTTILQVLIVEGSISGEILNTSYYSYTRIVILIFSYLICILMGTPEADVYAPRYTAYLNIVRASTVFLFFITLMCYGFRRLVDDLNFLMKIRPTFFIRVSWVISLLCITFVFLILFAFGKIYDDHTLFAILITGILLTLLIGFLLKFVKYLKAKDLTSLMKPTETWGSLDVEARTDRRLFNPRYEVRFRRKTQRCNHRCLLNSLAVKKTLEKELALVSNVLLEIEDDSQNRIVKKTEMEHLKQHRTAMSKYLAERSGEDYGYVLKKHARR